MRNTLRVFSIIFISISPETILNIAAKLFGNSLFERNNRKKKKSFILLSNLYEAEWRERAPWIILQDFV